MIFGHRAAYKSLDEPFLAGYARLDGSSVA
jgi:hypothetical protein